MTLTCILDILVCVVRPGKSESVALLKCCKAHSTHLRHRCAAFKIIGLLLPFTAHYKQNRWMTTCLNRARKHHPFHWRMKVINAPDDFTAWGKKNKCPCGNGKYLSEASYFSIGGSTFNSTPYLHFSCKECRIEDFNPFESEYYQYPFDMESFIPFNPRVKITD